MDGESPREPVDAADSIEVFARDLKSRRTGAGLSIRELAARGYASKTALNDAERGVVLPTDEVLVAYVRGAGGSDGDVRVWQKRAQDLRGRRTLAEGGVPTASASVETTAEATETPGTDAAAQPSRIRREQRRRGRALVIVLVVIAVGVLLFAALYRTDRPGDGGDDRADPLPPLGQPVVLESMNYPGCFLQVHGRQTVLGGADSMAAVRGSTFEVLPGLADDDGVSLRLEGSPDQYLRHTDWSLWLDARDGSASFDEAATFRMEPGLGDDRGVSFRALNDSDRYVRHWMSTFFVEGPERDTHTGTPFERDSTFYWQPPEPDSTPCQAL